MTMMNEQDANEAVQSLARILEDNGGQRLTLALVNGIAVTFQDVLLKQVQRGQIAAAAVQQGDAA